MSPSLVRRKCIEAMWRAVEANDRERAIDLYDKATLSPCIDRPTWTRLTAIIDSMER